MSYHPDSTNENAPTRAPVNNDNAAVAAGINYNQTVGDMAVKVSLGHINVSNPGSVMYDSNGDGTDDMTKGFDDKTFTNAGLSVGMGAFSLGVSWATRDDGGFVASGGGVMEDGSGQHDTVAVGIGYTDGPMSLSLDHMNRDAGERRRAHRDHGLHGLQAGAPRRLEELDLRRRGQRQRRGRHGLRHRHRHELLIRRGHPETREKPTQMVTRPAGAVRVERREVR